MNLDDSEEMWLSSFDKASWFSGSCGLEEICLEITDRTSIAFSSGEVDVERRFLTRR